MTLIAKRKFVYADQGQINPGDILTPQPDGRLRHLLLEQNYITDIDGDDEKPSRNVFTCEICETGFSSPGSLRKHLSRFHPDRKIPNLTKKKGRTTNGS